MRYAKIMWVKLLKCLHNKDYEAVEFLQARRYVGARDSISFITNNGQI